MMDEFSANFSGLLAGTKSVAFESFVRNLGEAKSRHEQDKIIEDELSYLKTEFVSANLTTKKTRELLLRLIYCEMLGHDGSFAYIHAIKFAQQTSLLEKRTGYLASSLFLNKDHELVVLLINTLQKDLKSTNVVAKSVAIDIVCKLISIEMAPALLPLIIASLKDKRAEIRKKSIMAVHELWKLDHTLVPNITSHLNDLLCDRDPAVMATSLHLFYDLIKDDVTLYRRYLKAFLQILKQIMDGKLDGYKYHNVQAPWLQIKLLKILALFGRKNKSTSDEMHGVLLHMVNTTPTDRHIGCAVMLECLKTITAIHPIKQLLDCASAKADLFLYSKSNSLKCLGITAVTSLVEIDSCYASDPQRQQIIIDCLDDDDLTLKKKTLELLYRITNRENIVLICEKLLIYLATTTDQYDRKNVVTKLTELAEKYAPDPLWYISLMNEIMQNAARCIDTMMTYNLMRFINTVKDDIKRQAVLQYIEILDAPHLSDCLVQVTCWVIGEHGHLLQNQLELLQTVLANMDNLLGQKFEDPATCGWILTALAKLTARTRLYTSEVRSIFERHETAMLPELRQRCHEMSMLCNNMELMSDVFPVNSSEDGVKVCPSLSFLDDFVAKALEGGAQPYQPRLKRDFQQASPEPPEVKSGFSIEPYAAPFTAAPLPAVRGHRGQHKLMQYSDDSEITPSELQQATKPVKAPKRHTPKKVWGPQGYMGDQNKSDSQPLKDDENVSRTKSSLTSTATTSAVKKTTGTIQSPRNTSSKEYVTNALFAGLIPKSAGQSDLKTSSHDQSGTTTLDEISSRVLQREDTTRKVDQPEATLLTFGDDFDSISQPNEALTGTTSSEEQNASTSPDTPSPGTPSPDTTSPGTTSSGTTSSHLHDTSGRDLQTPLLSVEISGGTKERSGIHSLLDKTDTMPGVGNTIGMKEQFSLVDLTADITRQPLSPRDSLTSNVGSDMENTQVVNLEPITVAEVFPEKLIPSSNVPTSTPASPTTELCSDSNIRLEYAMVHDPERIILKFTLTNQSQLRNILDMVSLTIEPPSNLTADDGTTNTVMVDSLEFLENVNHDLVLRCHHPALHMILKGTVKYCLAKTPKVLYFTQELSTKELVRRLDITTEQFGQNWTSVSNDVKQTVTMTSSKKCDDVVKAISGYMNMTVVDIIGEEGIAGGTILGTDLCLLHCTVRNKDLNLWFKSSSKLLSEVLMRDCALFSHSL